MQTDPIKGKTIRWTFEDGPTKGKAFEHTFGADGSVTYKMAGSPKAMTEKHYEAAKVGDDVYAVSYVASSGWTLTVVLDFRTHDAIGFASHDQELVVQHGHFESARKAA